MSMRWNRRAWMAGVTGGVFGFAARQNLAGLFAAEPLGNVKRCIVLWMDGGPSQLETFDPKPGATNGGPTRSIATSIPGVSIAENLPMIAERLDRLCVLRNLSSPEGDHGRGSEYLHTGYQPIPAFARPSLGALVSHASLPQAVPSFVSLGSTAGGPAYLGAEHAPFVIEDPQSTSRLIGELKNRRKRLALLDQFNQGYVAEHQSDALDRRRTTLDRVGKILDTSFGEALDLETASTQDRERYGEGDFARRCLTARRLLESGVRFVEVSHGGWDTHGNNFEEVASLCGAIDRPWATLLDDLQASGLWEETLVVWMGEFGRTPVINGTNGRDHFPDVTPVVIGGGGLKKGVVLGATNSEGTDIEGTSLGVPDLFATLLSALGRDPSEVLQTDFGSPAEVTDGGQAITELLA